MEDIVLDFRVLAFTLQGGSGDGDRLARARGTLSGRTNTALRDGGHARHEPGGTRAVGVRCRAGGAGRGAPLRARLPSRASTGSAGRAEVDPDGARVSSGCPPGTWRGGRGRSTGRSWSGCVRSRRDRRVRRVRRPSRATAQFPDDGRRKPEATHGRPVAQRQAGLLQTLSTAVVRGREFTATGDARTVPITIIHEASFAGTSPARTRSGSASISARSQPGGSPGFGDPERVIVGVVADTRCWLWQDVPESSTPRRPGSATYAGRILGFGSLLVRTRGDSDPCRARRDPRVDPRLPCEVNRCARRSGRP